MPPSGAIRSRRGEGSSACATAQQDAAAMQTSDRSRRISADNDIGGTTRRAVNERDSLHEFFNRFAFGQDRHGAISLIIEQVLVINAEHVIHGRENAADAV